MPRKNKTRYAILGMLNYMPMTGYDMKKMSDSSISHFWNENYGNIYPVLKKLEKEKLVSMIREDGNGTPARKVYTITDEGRTVFQHWLANPPDPEILRNELLLQVFFGQWTNPEIIMEKIRDEDRRCRNIITELEGIMNHLESGKSLDTASEELRPLLVSGTPYWKHTVTFGLHYYRGIREWCSETLKSTEKIIKGNKT